VAACGYRLAAGQARLADGEDALWLAPVGNHTMEPQAAMLLAASLRREAGRRGLKLDAAAQNVLEARLMKVEALVDAATLAGGRYSSRLQRLLVRVDFRLRRGGRLVWEKRLEESESYLAAPDLRGTEANRQAALCAVLERLAEEALGQIAAF
jgi:hypothetical protein